MPKIQNLLIRPTPSSDQSSPGLKRNTAQPRAVWRIPASRPRRDPDRGRANEIAAVGSLALMLAVGSIFGSLDGGFSRQRVVGEWEIYF